MQVLVTGGAGYVGSQTVRLLRGRGDDVVVLDDLSTGHREAIGDATLVVASVNDERSVDATVRSFKPDAVIHFAALKAADESLLRPDTYMATNVGGTATVLAAIARHCVPRFVFSSSCAVHGTPSSLPVRESAAIRPVTAYAESKHLVERMLRWYARAFGLRYASLGYFNAAGADPSGDHGERWQAARNLIPRVLKAASDRRPVEVFGTDYPTPDGTAVRDYVHVQDLAQAHLAALDYLDRAPSPVLLNPGTGRGASVLEVVATAREVTGRQIEVVKLPRRPGDSPAIWADASRAGRVLRWSARLDLRAVMSDAWRWHQRHPDGYGTAQPAQVGRAATGSPPVHEDAGNADAADHPIDRSSRVR